MPPADENASILHQSRIDPRHDAEPSMDDGIGSLGHLPIDRAPQGGTALSTDDEVQAQFDALREQWKATIPWGADIREMCDNNPAYQAIIALGMAVVPCILRDLATERHHWFHALRRITGAHPVPEFARGRLNEMAAAWLGWGHAQGMDVKPRTAPAREN